MVACDAKMRVNGKEKDYHWMVKCAPNDPGRMVIHRHLKVEKKEIGFYEDLLPRMKKFVKDRNASHKICMNFCKVPFAFSNGKPRNASGFDKLVWRKPSLCCWHHHIAYLKS